MDGFGGSSEDQKANLDTKTEVSDGNKYSVRK
jgi:hypothetical protein